MVILGATSHISKWIIIIIIIIINIIIIIIITIITNDFIVAINPI